MKALSLFLVLAALSSACTWVKPTDEAKDVVVGTMANVRGCEKLSTTNLKVVDTVGPISRSDEKVAQELINLGKNEAARLGADTIVPMDEPEQGRQTFSLFKCR